MAPETLVLLTAGGCGVSAGSLAVWWLTGERHAKSRSCPDLQTDVLEA